MQLVELRDGTLVSAIGQGTWSMAEDRSRRSDEIAALREGIELGMTVIDTAEKYAGGAVEELVADAIEGRRDRVFLVSKVLPENASRERLPLACHGSLRRLGTDRLDLYLLHWRGGVPLEETVEALEELKREGKILRWGVSNFDTGDMEELTSFSGHRCATNQILYNLSRRGPELGVLPWLAEHRMPVMAYSPVEQGRLLKNAALESVAQSLGSSPAQVALAWLLRRPSLIAVPKTAAKGIKTAQGSTRRW
ncbi:aldo/keto reductase [Qipengyuania sp. MTN3-11]|uniref:aldo/keto reductase n=1 Tax=Qipengyuania sp. MTN3-11 TaxID=3056557 RepID=UPI0036F36630